MSRQDKFDLKFSEDLANKNDDHIVNTLMFGRSHHGGRWIDLEYFGQGNLKYLLLDGSKVTKIQFTKIFQGKANYQICRKLNIPYTFQAVIQCYYTNKRWRTYGELWHSTGRTQFKVCERL